MKNVDVEAAVATATAIPVKTMSRSEKLRLWAMLILQEPGRLYIYHRIEYWCDDSLGCTITDGVRSAFHVAMDSPAFREQGLPAKATFKDAMKFFELDQTQLHEFSCDCGGLISNRDMANRIEAIADGRHSLVQRAMGFFR